MAVVVMTCYARSGGTLLNQCLGSLPNVVVLSELNPVGGGGGAPGAVACQTVQAQAAKWYGVQLKSQDFIGGVIELHDRCQQSGQHLVLRDWPFINFTPHHENANRPANRLLTLDALREHVELRPFAFVRNAIDVWISRNTPAADFACCYLRYVQAVVAENMPLFQYETFCETPETELRRLCDYARLPFSPAYRDYQSFETVNGDVQLVNASRGRRESQIVRLPRKPISASRIAQLRDCPQMIEANRLLGYANDTDNLISAESLGPLAKLAKLAKRFRLRPAA